MHTSLIMKGKRPVTKLHMTGTVMWKKRELGENIENKGAPRVQSEPPGKRKSTMSRRGEHTLLTGLSGTDRYYSGGGGWRLGGHWGRCSQCGSIPEAVSYLSQRNHQHCTVELVLYETSRHAPVSEVTLRAPKAANPSAGLFPNSQVSYGFFQSLLLISRSKSRGPSKLGKD